MNLRKATIHLAQANPELRGVLLPLVSKEARPGLDHLETLDQLVEGGIHSANEIIKTLRKWKSYGNVNERDLASMRKSVGALAEVQIDLF